MFILNTVVQILSCKVPKTSMQEKGSQDSQHPAQDWADTIESSARAQNPAVIQFTVGYC